jgi:hypothetical protein
MIVNNLYSFWHSSCTHDIVQRSRRLPMKHPWLGQLCKFAIFYYARFINEDIGQLCNKVLQWWEKGSPAYGIADPKELVGPLCFWDFVKFAFKGSRLARLALVILSIIINTTTYEHLFSELA